MSAQLLRAPNQCASENRTRKIRALSRLELIMFTAVAIYVSRLNTMKIVSSPRNYRPCYKS